MQFDKREQAEDARDTAGCGAVDASAVSVDAALPGPSAAIAVQRRITLCPCGSGRRYKHCCGALVAKSPAALLHYAVRLMNAGEATRAERALSALRITAYDLSMRFRLDR